MIPVDDNRHGEEFRLRVLTTNVCNKGCSYCLNDFQIPDKQPRYISAADAMRATELYVGQCKAANTEPIITFAGGEPALHPRLAKMVMYAYDQIEASAEKGQIVVVTNGTACSLIGITLRSALLDPELPIQTRFHIHVPVQDTLALGRHLGAISRFASKFRTNTVIQTVVGSHTSLDALGKLGWFCKTNKVPLKVFSDFFEPGYDPTFVLDRALDGIWGLDLKTRFTGVQTNRGKACAGCTKRCITLKGVWALPDGSLEICPQGHEYPSPYACYTSEWFRWAYEAHQAQQN